MRFRDLFRLPLGVYYLTDGIRKYTLQKLENERGNKLPYYSIREYGNIMGGSVCFYETLSDVFDDSSRYKQKYLKAHVFISGMSFRAEYGYQLSPLKFIPKTTYKQWLKGVEADWLLPNSDQKAERSVATNPNSSNSPDKIPDNK